MVCYGLDDIAEVWKVIEHLKEFFSEVDREELRRPGSFLSATEREGLLLKEKKVVGDLLLWESPLGKTAGGAHPNLFEKVKVAAHE